MRLYVNRSVTNNLFEGTIPETVGQMTGLKRMCVVIAITARLVVYDSDIYCIATCPSIDSREPSPICSDSPHSPTCPSTTSLLFDANDT